MRGEIKTGKNITSYECDEEMTGMEEGELEACPRKWKIQSNSAHRGGAGACTTTKKKEIAEKPL
jgi:hypothetical protein